MHSQIDKLKLVGTVGAENPEAKSAEEDITADSKQHQKNQQNEIDMTSVPAPSRRRKVKVKRSAKSADTAEKESVGPSRT